MPLLYRHILFCIFFSTLVFVVATEATAQTCDWINVVADSTGNEQGNAITTDRDNNIIACGRFTNNLKIGPYNLTASGTENACIVKYRPDSSLVWTIQAYNGNNTQCYYRSIATDANSNIYVIATIVGTVDFGNNVSLAYSSFSLNNITLVKYDSTGTAQWARMINGNNMTVWQDVVVDGSDNIVVGFTYSDSCLFEGTMQKLTSNGGLDMGIVKYSPTGAFIKAATFGGANSEVFSDIEADSSNSLYILGHSSSSFSFGTQTLQGTGQIVLKIDSAFLPVKGIKTTLSTGIVGFYRPYQIAVKENGDFAVASVFWDSVDFGNGVYLQSPYRTNLSNFTSSMFIAYYNNQLIAQWARANDTLSAISLVVPRGGIKIKNNHIYFGGQLQNGSIRFGNHVLKNPIREQFFIGKMDVLGNFIWVFGSADSVGWTDATGIAVDNMGDACIVGLFARQIRVIDKTKTAYMPPPGLDMFVARISDCEIYRGGVNAGPYCAGDSIKIPYTLKGKYNPGNQLIAQLSDSAGNFDGNEQELGRIASTQNGVITGRIPLLNIPTANRYQIRIISSNPATQNQYRFDTLRLLIYSKDSANAGPDTTICTGQTITLGTTGGSKWNWSPATYMLTPGDTTNRHPAIKPTNQTEYRVIISDTMGCGYVDTDYVTVTVRPPITAEIYGDSTICRGHGQWLKARVSGGNGKYWYRWRDINFGIVLSTNDSLFVKPFGTTTYLVIVGDSCSDKTDTAQLKITIENTFAVLLTADTTICTGRSVGLAVSAASCDTSQIEYTWDNGLGSGNYKTVSPAITTTYTVIGTNKFNGLKDTARVTVTVRPSLKITINPDTTICFGQTAQLRAIATGGDTANYSILWTVGSGQWTSANPNVTVSPVTTTTYTATLSDGCTIPSDSAKITVTVRPPLQVTVNTDTTVCVGEAAQLRANVLGGFVPGHTLLWTADNGPWTSNNSLETVSPASTTTYTAILNDGCTIPGDSAKITVTVRPPLKVTVNADTTICTGQTAELRATATGGFVPGYKIQWFATANQWTDTNYTVTVNPLTTSVYTVRLTDDCSTGDSAKVTITVRPPLSVNITAKDSICANRVVLLTANTSGGNAPVRSLLWTVDGGPWTSLQNPATDTPKVTTTYIATLSDNCSPAVTDSFTVTVLPAPKANFGIFPSKGCPPLAAVFTDSSTGNDTLLNRWKVETAEPAGVASHAHLFDKTGRYTVSLLVSNVLGCTDYIQKTNAVEVFEKPTAAFILKPDSKEAETPLLLFNYSQRATRYSWDMGDGSVLWRNDRNDTTYTYKDTGNLWVQLVAINNNNCTDTAKQLIRIFDKVNCAVPNAFTPGNSDNLNPVFAPVCAGVINFTLTIYNRWGQVIHTCENCGWDGTYMDTPVPAGVYMYKLHLHGESHKKSMVYGTVNVIR